VRLRTIFLSDIHLGTQGCQATMLLDFLERHDADRIFLIGDIVDGWRLKRGWFWPQAHSDVVQTLLSKARGGARIVYVPGNHDELMRQFLGTHFGGVEVMEEAEHVTADGRRLLVTHGDRFDSIVAHAKWLAHLGDRAYAFALWLNTWVNRMRRLWGGHYWSLSNWAKQQVKGAVNYISEYESVLADDARRGGFDGVVCGHIHAASIRRIGGLDYVNTGDWVESCTAIVEHSDGRLELIDWAAEMRARTLDEAASRLARIRRLRARRRIRKKEDA
jgi:UDP-2,3-diacylglucosamine pyrophosphatase LpxH